MKAPKRKKPPMRKVAKDLLTKEERGKVAKKAHYIGSQEHKQSVSFAGPPKLRSDASKCPTQLNKSKDNLSFWIRKAIRKHNFSDYFEGDFPRYIWHKENGVCFEARLVNRTNGAYKGYPLSETEHPIGLEE